MYNGIKEEENLYQLTAICCLLYGAALPTDRPAMIFLVILIFEYMAELFAPIKPVSRIQLKSSPCPRFKPLWKSSDTTQDCHKSRTIASRVNHSLHSDFVHRIASSKKILICMNITSLHNWGFVHLCLNACAAQGL